MNRPRVLDSVRPVDPDRLHCRQAHPADHLFDLQSFRRQDHVHLVCSKEERAKKRAKIEAGPGQGAGGKALVLPEARSRGTGRTGDSLDPKLYDAVREQAGKAGLQYKADAPAY